MRHATRTHASLPTPPRHPANARMTGAWFLAARTRGRAHAGRYECGGGGRRLRRRRGPRVRRPFGPGQGMRRRPARVNRAACGVCPMRVHGVGRRWARLQGGRRLWMGAGACGGGQRARRGPRGAGAQRVCKGLRAHGNACSVGAAHAGGPRGGMWRGPACGVEAARGKEAAGARPAVCGGERPVRMGDSPYGGCCLPRAFYGAGGGARSRTRFQWVFTHSLRPPPRIRGRSAIWGVIAGCDTRV